MPAEDNDQALHQQRGQLLLFAKTPAAGQVKTRLVPALGTAGAVELASAMLLDSWQLALELTKFVDPVLVLAGSPVGAEMLSPAPAIWDQGDGDLGQRLERAFLRALSTRPLAIALGTDSPGLPTRHVVDAIERLQEPTGAECVLGPVADGGYYLIGLRRCPAGFFDTIPWSSVDTCSLTIERAERFGLRVELTAPWFDVDLPEDLSRLRNDISDGRVYAPHTARTLERFPPRVEEPPSAS